jgi:hypothetical protein
MSAAKRRLKLACLERGLPVVPPPEYSVDDHRRHQRHNRADRARQPGRRAEPGRGATHAS